MFTQQKSIQLRHDIVTLRQENPAMTLQHIAIIVNRSRERVRQILVSENIETRSAKRVKSANRPTPLCRLCNTEILTYRSKTRVYCDECVRTKVSHIDRGLRIRRIPRVHIPCCYCDAIIDMRKTLYESHQKLYKNLFCSTSCRTRYLWDNKVLVNIGGTIMRGKIEE